MDIDRLILGSNAFEGVSYISRSQSLHYQEQFGKAGNIVPILDAAWNLGVRSFTCSNCENVLSALAEFDRGRDLSLFPVIPNAYEYAREASEKGVLGAIKSRTQGISMYQKVRLGLRALSKIGSVVSMDVLKLLVELINLELASFEKYKMSGIVLHGQITDLALSSRNGKIIEIFQNFILETFKTQPILATHNLGVLLPKLMEWKIRIPIMAPLNERGFMMRPTGADCEKLVEESGYDFIAKKVLAGGRLSPEQGFRYIADKKVASVVVGVGSVSEAYHTFAVARSALKL